METITIPQLAKVADLGDERSRDHKADAAR